MREPCNFTSSQREWANHPEFYEPELTLIDYGTCPYCQKELAWDRVDDAIAWCETPGCKYDNGITEEENREIAQKSMRGEK